MFNLSSGDKWLGLVLTVSALLLLFVWIPLDIDSGITETARRQVTLGDSLGPVVAGAVILIGGVLTFATPNSGAPSLSLDNLKWLGLLIGTLALSLGIMRFSGSLITELLTDQSYRSLRATPPWNYIGYIIGGTFMVAGLISLVRGKTGLSPILIGLAASLVIALLYDLPFDDLQLPPNGDV